MRTGMKWTSFLLLVALLAAMLPGVIVAAAPPPPPPPQTPILGGVYWVSSPKITIDPLPGHVYVGESVVLQGTIDYRGTGSAAVAGIIFNRNPENWVAAVADVGYYANVLADGDEQWKISQHQTVINTATGGWLPVAFAAAQGSVVHFQVILTSGSAGKQEVRVYADNRSYFLAGATVDGEWIAIDGGGFAWAELVRWLEWAIRSEWTPGNRKVVLRNFPTGYRWVNIRRWDTSADGFVWTVVPSGRPMDQQPVSGSFNYELFLDPQGSNSGLYSAQACNGQACTEWRTFGVSPAPFVGDDAYDWGSLPQVTNVN